MGVGNFSSDFNGSGNSLIIEDFSDTYEDYVADAKKNNDDYIMKEREWLETTSSDFYEHMISSLRESLKKIGYASPKTRERMEIDNDFLLLAQDDNDMVSIGLRQWENDYVLAIAAGPSSKDAFDGSYDEIEFLEAFHMSEDNFKEKFANLTYHLQAYLIQELLKNGFSPRYRTSAWTSQKYTEYESIDTEMLKNLHKDLVVSRDSDYYTKSLPTKDRESYVKALLSIQNKERIYNHMNMMVVGKDEGRICGWGIDLKNEDPSSWNEESNLPIISQFSLLPETVAYMRPFLDTLGADNDFIALPFNEHTRAEYIKHSTDHMKNNTIFIPGEDFIKNAEDDLKGEMDNLFVIENNSLIRMNDGLQLSMKIG